MESWPLGAHGTTFGGNPVACAAAIAGIDVLAGLLGSAEELSKRAFERLGKLEATYETIGDVRGLGLMIGVDLVKASASAEANEPNPEAMKALQSHALRNELILVPCGPHDNVIRFIPPLVTEMDELDRAIDLIDEGLASYELG